METLRRAMLHSGGRIPGSITLTVARKIGHSHSHNHSHGHNSSMSSNKLNLSSAETVKLGGNSTMDEMEDISEQSSDKLDSHEANTVIYVPNRYIFSLNGFIFVQIIFIHYNK